MGERYAKLYAVLNTTNREPEVDRLYQRGQQVRTSTKDLPAGKRVRGLSQDDTHNFQARLVDIGDDGVPGEFDGFFIVRVFRGAPDPLILVSENDLEDK